jgi:hypothetical protein
LKEKKIDFSGKEHSFFFSQKLFVFGVAFLGLNVWIVFERRRITFFENQVK